MATTKKPVAKKAAPKTAAKKPAAKKVAAKPVAKKATPAKKAAPKPVVKQEVVKPVETVVPVKEETTTPTYTNKMTKMHALIASGIVVAVVAAVFLIAYFAI